MLIKVNSANQVAGDLIIVNKKETENEVLQVFKSVFLIIFCSVIAPSLFFVYQLANAQPKSHFGRNRHANTNESIALAETNKHQYLPSNINFGIVEMGPFLVPICNIVNKNSERPSNTKVDLIDVNANELFSMVETKK